MIVALVRKNNRETKTLRSGNKKSFGVRKEGGYFDCECSHFVVNRTSGDFAWDENRKNAHPRCCFNIFCFTCMLTELSYWQVIDIVRENVTVWPASQIAVILVMSFKILDHRANSGNMSNVNPYDIWLRKCSLGWVETGFMFALNLKSFQSRRSKICVVFSGLERSNTNKCENSSKAPKKSLIISYEYINASNWQFYKNVKFLYVDDQIVIYWASVCESEKAPWY